MGLIVRAPATLGEPLGPFARLVEVPAALDIVVISGTSAQSHLSGPRESRVIPSSFDEQARLTFRNIELCLDDAGTSWSDVFKFFIILKRASDYDEFNVIRREVLPIDTMASTLIVADLVRNDQLIEIETWVAIKRSE